MSFNDHEHKKLSPTLTLSHCHNPTNGSYGFWLYDETRGQNLAMRAKTSTDALVEALTYYQDRLTSVEQEHEELQNKVDLFVSQSEAYQNQCRRLGFDDKVHKPDYDPRSVSFNVIERFKAAHQAANNLSNIIAELRDTLGPELMEMLCATVEPEHDMTDWRNWRAGDKLKCVDGNYALRKGKLYTFDCHRETDEIISVEEIEGRFDEDRFRFHSRPTVKRQEAEE